MGHAVIGFCCLVYLAVGIFGILYAGPYTKGNILLNFSPDDGLINIGRFGLALTVIFSTPLLVVPCRKAMERCVQLTLEATGVEMLEARPPASSPAKNYRTFSSLGHQGDQGHHNHHQHQQHEQQQQHNGGTHHSQSSLGSVASLSSLGSAYPDTLFAEDGTVEVVDEGLVHDEEQSQSESEDDDFVHLLSQPAATS